MHVLPRSLVLTHSPTRTPTHLCRVGVVDVEHLLARVLALHAGHICGHGLGKAGAELPHVHALVIRCNDVLVGDGQALGLDLQAATEGAQQSGVGPGRQCRL